MPKGASGRLGTVRLRQAGDIPSVCFSPDGRAILAGSAQAEHAVYLWDARDGTRRHRIRVAGGVGAVAYSPDGKRVAAVTSLSGKGDRGVVVWDASTGKELHRLQLPEGAGKICFSPQGHLLAILAGEDELLLWRPGRKPRSFKCPRGWGTGLAFSPDGRRLAGGLSALREGDKAERYSVCVWDVGSGKRTHLLEGHENNVCALAFSRDGRRLISGGWDEENAVRLWDLDKGKELPALPGRRGEALAMWLSPDDKTLLVADGDGLVRGWRLPAGAPLKGLPKLDPGPHASTAVAFSADGKRLVMGSWDGSAGASSSIKLWELATGRRLLRGTGHEGEVCCLAFTADGRLLASCAADGAILWNARVRRPVRRFGSRKLWPDVVAISPDGALLALSQEDRGQIHLFDRAGRELPALTWEPKRVRGRPVRGSVSWMRFSPDGRSLAAAASPGVLLWRLIKGGKPEGGPRVLAGSNRAAWAGGFSRGGKTFTAGTSVGAIRWDAASGKELSRVGHEVNLWGRKEQLGSAAVLSPDGKLLAVGGNYGALSLWDTTAGKEVARLLANADDFDKGFRALAFSPDGRVLASGNRSGLIRFWDVARRKEIARREGHTGMVRCLLFSPDGRTLASGGSDTTVLLWPVPGRKE